MADWKELLAEDTDPKLSGEIDIFETQMELRRKGLLDEKIFAETRLRRGVYGQRYDNGQRDDGEKVQHLHYPCGDLTKGPETVWDAPGMQRIKIPFGGLTPDQLDCLADLSEEYSDGVLHVTTRQDIQLHFVHIEDTPPMMRRLAAVGITTREACGNSVRNVTACPLSGVCRAQAFDVTPYAKALAGFLLGHPDAQDFGRKFKIAFSGCRDTGCGLARMHDIGAVAAVRWENGKERRGFEFYVGGGLGAVPRQAELFSDFLPEEELLPTSQAICRVFARLGEKKQRSRARLKFLLAKIGMDEFRRQVRLEREQLVKDSRWTSEIEKALFYDESPLKPPSNLREELRPEGFEAWYESNVYSQRQEGYAVVTIGLPLGDFSAWQARRVADLARRYSGDSIRLTVEQNIVFRWVTEEDLPDLFTELRRIGLDRLGGESIHDITACPGTDTCKLGISSSRGLASEVSRRLAVRAGALAEEVRRLRIKISGCFNSCGQHHIADLGFYGISRTIGGRKVPHFQVILGGTQAGNARSYGLAVGAVPARRIPDTIDRIIDRYAAARLPGEQFADFIARIGKKEVRRIIEDLMKVPSFEVDPGYYTNWGDPRVFTLGDMGVGECAGEVVSVGEFEMAAAERLVFEAQLQLDDGNFTEADRLAYEAMLEVVRSLLKTAGHAIAAGTDALVKSFREQFFDTKLFHDRYAGGKFGQYLLKRHANPPADLDRKRAHRLIEEAQLFIEAGHSCRDRLADTPASDDSWKSRVSA